MTQQGEEVAVIDCRQPSSPADKSSIFYRMIVPSIIQDKKLRIPGKFAKKLGHELPAVVTLTTPDGCVWQVGLKKIDDKVWFADGWHEFVKHQSIRVGYLVVFTHAGKSNFSVNIYDLATAEIKYQCNSTLSSSKGPSCGNHHPVSVKEEADDDNLVEILDLCPPCRTPTYLENKVSGGTADQQKLGKRYNTPLLQNLVKSINGTELKNSYCKINGGNLHVDAVRLAARSAREVGIQFSYGEPVTSPYEIRFDSLNPRPEITRKRKPEIVPYERELSAKHVTKVQIPGTGTSCATLLRRWRTITPEEKERVLNASKMFQSEKPFCRVILRRSYVYKGIGLHMPSSFSEQYLRGVSGFITLQVCTGKKWPVRCMWRDGSTKLSKGWTEFVSDNRLEEGDACVFELIKAEEVVLKVTIFRVVEDAEPVNQLLPRTSQLATGYDLNG